MYISPISSVGVPTHFSQNGDTMPPSNSKQVHAVSTSLTSCYLLCCAVFAACSGNIIMHNAVDWNKEDTNYMEDAGLSIIFAKTLQILFCRCETLNKASVSYLCETKCTLLLLNFWQPVSYAVGASVHLSIPVFGTFFYMF